MSSGKLHFNLPMYGPVALPELVHALLQTPTVQRLHNIGLTILPKEYSPNWAGSRFWHSLEVAYLMSEVIRFNPNLAAQTGRPSIKSTLLAAALLHDAASTPCSHLVEALLKEATGKNIEQRLPDFLKLDKQLIFILNSFDVDFDLMCQLVTGQHSLSNVLSGNSLDIDNLDNIQLVAYYTQIPIVVYSPVRLARSFRLFQKSQTWFLPESASHLARNWQIARHQLYTGIDQPHILSVVVMLRYCLATAYGLSLLPVNFFDFDDSQLVAELKKTTIPGIQNIIAHLDRKEFFPQIWELKLSTTQFNSLPSKVRAKLNGLRSQPSQLARFSDQLAESFALPQGSVLMYVGSSKTYRPVNGLFISQQKSNTSALEEDTINLRVYNGSKKTLTSEVVAKHLLELGLNVPPSSAF